MDKLRMTSPDLTDANIGKLAELFPTVITEATGADGTVTRAVDFDLLRQELSDHIVEGPQERYRLDWPGKRQAAFAANTTIAKTLRPVREESVNFDATKNIFIEGDNLEALKLLQEPYLGKVKMIYIDPPYNTGNDFVYHDDFSESEEDYIERSGQSDETGVKFLANPETNGRFHSDWLSMLYPRLKLARNLLREDGAVFMSINDAELENLKHAASEVFGAQNFVGTMVWAAGRKNDSRFISSSHEYIVCFARDLNKLREIGVNWKIRKKGLDDIYKAADKFVKDADGDFAAASAALKRWYKSLPDSDEAKRNKHYSRIDQRGVFFADNISWPGGGGPKYDVLHPVTGRPVRIPSRGWLFQKDAMKRHVKDGRVLFGDDENAVPTFKRYLRDTENEVAYSVFYQDGRAATKRLRSLMGKSVFDFPKDETVIQTLVEMVTSDDDLVLDFFAGSGTTAHAVYAANAADGGARKYIMVQLNEPVASGSTAAKSGFKVISQISRERICRAAEQVGAGVEMENWDGGFRSFYIDSSNMTDSLRTPDDIEQLDLSLFEGSIKEGRTGEDLLFQVFLDWGLELSMPIVRETVDGCEVFFVEDDALAACFEDEVSLDVIREIAKRQPLRAVFRDDGFADDAARINVEQIFRELSPATDVKAI
ncbi:MAG: site-specific DNA-methyltransferase [Brevibacterium aurantiacum]